MIVKNKTKNQHGFTLIELLVVIVIIGIITVLALPGVQQLQARNRNKKYETYSSTLKSAGKLYTDSYADDMFGMTGNGCFDISYNELKGKSLIKDFSSEGITCDDPSTFVQVKRSGGQYTYDVSLKCLKDGAVIYENVLSSCGEQSLTATDAPVIFVDIQNQGGYDDWSTSKKVVIRVESKNGLTANSSISYGWTEDVNVLPTMRTEYFRNDTGIYEFSFDFIESGKNGIWNLIVDGDHVIDVGGLFASDKVVENIKFDNTVPSAPVLDNPYNNVWTGNDVISNNLYKISMTATDTYSGIREYQYKYSSSGDWISYSSSSGDSFITPPFTEQKNDTIEIRACDYAGNCSTSATSTIKIDTSAPSCSIILDGTTGNNGWYKSSDVALTLNRSDSGGSSISAYDLTTSSTASYNGVASATQSDTSGITWYGYVKDGAGNLGYCNSDTFKVDKTKPSCTMSVTSGTVNSSGNYTTNVTVSLTRSDALSKVDSYGVAKSNSANYNGGSSLSASSNGTYTYYGFVKDKAGNTKSCNVSFTISKYSCSSGTLTYDSSKGYICVKSANKSSGITGYTNISCGGSCSGCNDGICGPPNDGCWGGTSGKAYCSCPKFGTTYSCSSGWSKYSGSGSSMKCYKKASS